MEEGLQYEVIRYNMKAEQQSHQLRLTRMKGGLLCILVTVLSTLVVSEAAAYKTTFKSAKAPRGSTKR